MKLARLFARKTIIALNETNGPVAGILIRHAEYETDTRGGYTSKRVTRLKRSPLTVDAARTLSNVSMATLHFSYSTGCASLSTSFRIDTNGI